MINKKYSQPLFMIFMSFGMSLIIGGVVTLVHTGFGEGFFNRLLDAFIYSFPVASNCSIYYGSNYETSC